MTGKDLFASPAPAPPPAGRDLFASDRLDALAAEMTPDELRTAQTKNDEMGEHLRAKAQQARPGEDEAARFKRIYGGLTMPERPGMAEGMTRGYFQGGTFGFGDEAVAGVAAAHDALGGDNYGEAYNLRLAQERNKIDQFRKDSPGAAYGSEIIGAIPSSMFGPLNAIRGGNYVKGVRTGLGQGFLYGYGSGEGDVASRVESGGIGGGIGGPFGAAGVAIAKGIGNLVGGHMTRKAAKDAGMSTPAYQILNRGLQADDALTGGGAQRMAKSGGDAMLADAGSALIVYSIRPSLKAPPLPGWRPKPLRAASRTLAAGLTTPSTRQWASRGHRNPAP